MATVAVLCGTAAAAGMARDTEAAFGCPDPSKAPLGKMVSANQATVCCNDGASATAVVGAKSLNFTGGVCYRESGAFYVEIGTVPGATRRSASPPGFEILDNKPGAFAKDSVHLGKDTFIWDGAVTIKFASRTSGKWAGSGYRRVGAKLVSAKASGKFNCKRILTVPG
jgi:hypothetical protein